eukprot:918393-Pelagomonas_calceolata.AAC.2
MENIGSKELEVSSTTRGKIADFVLQNAGGDFGSYWNRLYNLAARTILVFNAAPSDSKIEDFLYKMGTEIMCKLRSLLEVKAYITSKLFELIQSMLLLLQLLLKALHLCLRST